MRLISAGSLVRVQSGPPHARRNNARLCQTSPTCPTESDKGSNNDRFEFVRRKKFQCSHFPSRALTWGRFFDICIQGRKIQLLELSLKTRVSSYRFPGSRES